MIVTLPSRIKTQNQNNMDYAIKKTTDGKFPRIICRFTQEENNHRAKAAARTKLKEMWLRVLQRPSIMKDGSIEGDKDAFSYNHMLGVGIYERIRFYIDKL